MYIYIYVYIYVYIYICVCVLYVLIYIYTHVIYLFTSLFILMTELTPPGADKTSYDSDPSGTPVIMTNPGEAPQTTPISLLKQAFFFWL